MKPLLLSCKRSFNAKAYLILVGLLVPAAFAIRPYSRTLTATAYPGFWTTALDGGINLLLFAALGAAGLWLASRIGLGMPLIEGWIKREPSWNRLPGIAGISVLAGILLPLFLVLEGAFASVLQPATIMQAESSTAQVIDPPAWQGFLASFSAGITEETIFRLFGLTLLVWLGDLLFHRQTGRPSPWLLWTANIVFAILFGLAHLPLTSQLGISIDAVVVIRTILRNGMGGLLFGWLYWSFGLESAMLAHFSADLVLHGLVPLVKQQANPTLSLIVGGMVGLIWVAAVLWSIRLILRDRKLFPPTSDSMELKPWISNATNQ